MAGTLDETGSEWPMPSRYRYVSVLGKGGAGVVYRAEDTELHRPVALKFLSDHLTEDDGARARFLQEARAASRLDHPNICTIFEAGSTERDQMFIAMACYDGETLDKRIRRGPLPLAEVLDVACQVARGLAKAHGNDVLHRDIKPANLMITDDGVVKILDFGIAKVSDRKLTRTGAAIGTVAYMSPEQLDGEGVDYGTDLWSLGVVIHEMVTGQPVFGSGTEWRVMSAIVQDAHERLVDVRDDCPPTLSDAVDRCLAKNRADRFGSVVELLECLEAISTDPTLPASAVGVAKAQPVTRARSGSTVGIVIRPFEDISPDKDNAHISDGVTEEIITDLSRLNALRVISRSSAMMLKGDERSAVEIGKQLSVEYVLEGGVRRHGDKLRITAHLIHAATEEAVWAEKFSGGLEDIFDIQERVAFAVVEALKLKLTATQEKELAAHPIENVHAFECHLRARQEIWSLTPDALDRAEALLENGLEIVGDNALLYAGLGQVHCQRTNLGIRPMDSLGDAERYARKALELDPRSPQADYVLSLIAAVKGQLRESVKHLQRTLTVDPANTDGLATLVFVYGYLGQTSQAFSLLDRLVSIDPLSPVHAGTLGWLHLVDGRSSLAAEQYRGLCELLPSSPVYGIYHAIALAHDRKTEDACRTLEQLEVDHPDNPSISMAVLLRHALTGDKVKTLETLTPELDAMGGQAMFAAWLIASCLALVGEGKRSMDQLENAVRLGFINYPFLSRLDPLLASVRGEPRFEELMRMVKMEWEQFEA